MRKIPALTIPLFLSAVLIACSKDNKKTDCLPNLQTTREINNKRAIVQITGDAAEPVYLTEEGTIDTKLIPCNLASEFYEDGLTVTISGEVKQAPGTATGPCCTEYFVITSISR